MLGAVLFIYFANCALGLSHIHSITRHQDSSEDLGAIGRGLQERIVESEDTTVEEHPYQVSLQREGRHRCGGSIISKYFVLTAAHCFPNRSIPLYQVRVGTSYHKTGGHLHKIYKLFVHPEYDKFGHDFDIAVLRVATPFIYSPTVQPVLLPEENEEIEPNSLAVVIGWGRASKTGKCSSVLQKVEIPTIDNFNCTQIFLSLYHVGLITPRMLCAGQEGTIHDSYKGDSGGPLVVGNKQMGIVSWGKGSGKPFIPGVYTRVAVLRSWIHAQSGV